MIKWTEVKNSEDLKNKVTYFNTKIETGDEIGFIMILVSKQEWRTVIISKKDLTELSDKFEIFDDIHIITRYVPK